MIWLKILREVRYRTFQLRFAGLGAVTTTGPGQAPTASAHGDDAPAAPCAGESRAGKLELRRSAQF